MADDHLRYLMDHADDIVPVLYEHARKLAARKFGWREGKTLPLGNTPEDIVTEVYLKYVNGKRNFDPAKDVMLQLKGSVRSSMWAVRTRSSATNELLATEEDDEAGGLPKVKFASNDPTAESVESADFAKAVVGAVNLHPRFKASKDLQDLMAACDLKATTVEDQVRMLGMNSIRVHQLRHQLREIYREVLADVNRTQETTK